MTRTQLSAIAIALSAIVAGPALADNTGVTRAQVQAELAEAVRSGDIRHHSGLRMNQVYKPAYTAQEHAAAKSREQVQAELADAVRTGDIAHYSGPLVNEVNPQAYPAQPQMASKTRRQVQAELAEAVRQGNIKHHSGQRMNEVYARAYAPEATTSNLAEVSGQRSIEG